MKGTKWLCMLLAVILIMTTFGIPQAEAAGRTAIIRTVVGDVYITKAGGSRELRAYEGMTLNEKDRIRTASDSAVTVAVADRDDTVTLDANTEMYISELNETEGGKKSRLRVWAGQMAVKAQSMFGSSDEMEVETPNATMGVRGTFFVTQFSPEYDDTWISVFSGVVESFRRDAHNREGSPLFPTQEAHYFSFPDEDSPSDVVTMLDLDDFIEKVGEEVIQRLLLNRDEIDQENRDRRDAIIEGLRNHGFILFDGNTGEVSEEELTRLDQNLQVLVDSVINRAVENSRLSEEELQEILEEINQGRVGSPLSIDRERSLEDLQGEQSRRSQEMLERMRERQEELIEERRQQREQMQDQNQQLLDRLQQQRERQQEANRQAEIEESERAKREYTDRLSEMERERFEQRLREREEERQRAEEERAKREERRKQVADTDERSTRAGGTGGSGTGGETPPAPDPDPQPDPEPTPDPEPEPQPDPDPEPEPAQPSVKFSADRIVVTPEGVDVAVQLYNVENISAIQLNVHYPSYLHVHVHRESDALLVGDSNPIIEYREVVAGGELTPDGEKEWIYAMLVDEQLREVAEAGADGVTIATIRFTPEVALLDFEETLTGSIELVGIHLVDAEGNELVPKIDTSDARIEFTVSLDRGKAD